MTLLTLTYVYKPSPPHVRRRCINQNIQIHEMSSIGLKTFFFFSIKSSLRKSENIAMTI
uniref:Uncharacterized protein n=1 Tax=Octopus bimaculoides TaxID=37653 RepID=A0A0L8H5L9_OCTBM